MTGRISRACLFLRIWLRYWHDEVMWGRDWARNEYRARMHAFKGMKPDEWYR